MAGRKRGSTEVVRCRECEFDDRERYVVVIAYEDGDVEVRCDGGCSGCKYQAGSVEAKGVNWGREENRMVLEWK